MDHQTNRMIPEASTRQLAEDEAQAEGMAQARAREREDARFRAEPVHGDDLPVPDEYVDVLPMPGDRW